MIIIIGWSMLSAWILSWFGFDTMLMEVIQPHTETSLTNSHYYILFCAIGLVIYLFSFFRRSVNHD